MSITISKKNILKTCISLKNNTSMEVCNKKVKNNTDICGIHKKRNYIYLQNGSIWENKEKSSLLEECVLYRKKIPFWDILQYVSFDSLHTQYKPLDKKDIRNEKYKYILSELCRLHVNVYVKPERSYWYLQLLYYLGNCNYKVKVIQRFCRGKFKKVMEKRKKAVSIIEKYYINYRFFKNIPRFIKHYRCLQNYKCININDPISQESFMEVDPERWVICENNNNSCWWFDITSAIQILGSSSSHSGENPLNRKEFPPAFLFDIEHKINIVKGKYNDIVQYLYKKEELKQYNIVIENSTYQYERFMIHIKANKLFESFKEFGYSFPKKVFMKYTIQELRLCIIKIYRSWLDSDREYKEKIFPNGIIFPDETINRLSRCSNATYLRNTILNNLLQAITYNTNYNEKIYICIKMLLLFGNINIVSHNIIHQNNLCDCRLERNRRLTNIDNIENVIQIMF